MDETRPGNVKDTHAHTPFLITRHQIEPRCGEETGRRGTGRSNLPCETKFSQFFLKSLPWTIIVLLVPVPWWELIFFVVKCATFVGVFRRKAVYCCCCCCCYGRTAGAKGPILMDQDSSAEKDNKNPSLPDEVKLL